MTLPATPPLMRDRVEALAVDQPVDLDRSRGSYAREPAQHRAGGVDRVVRPATTGRECAATPVEP